MNNNNIKDTSSSDDEVPQKKHALNVNFKEKFEKLKEKRQKLVQKNLKKIQKSKQPIKIELCQSDEPTVDNKKLKEHVLNYNTHIKNLDWNQLNDDVGLKNEKNDLESDLNSAIKTKNIELAEEINEKLIDYESKLHINYAVSAYKYKTVNEPDRQKAKKLKWQFEAKERWESKSNM
jgi:hypothetical protein